MKGFVLDSYALIAYLEDEPGAEAVERHLREAERGKADLLLSRINWAEVYYSVYRAKGEAKAEECLVVMEQLPIEVIEAGAGMAYDAARLKANHSIALGDCFAAALAISKSYPVLTGDKEFRKLGKKIAVEWLA